jgi:hypothetical protein
VVVESVMDLNPRATVDAVVDHFVESVGGAAMFGKMLLDEYRASPAGSLVRQRILELILRRMQLVEAQGKVEDLGEVTDADLRLMLAARESEMLALIREPEVPPKEPPTPPAT